MTEQNDKEKGYKEDQVTDHDKNHDMNKEHNHESDHNHDHDDEYEDELDVIVLTLEDDSELECGVLEIFSYGDKEYIALVTLDDEQKVLLYEFQEGENEGEIEVLMIETEEEFNEVAEAFQNIMDEYDEGYEEE